MTDTELWDIRSKAEEDWSEQKLRIEFAKLAMQSLITCQGVDAPPSYADLVHDAWQIADGMLAEAIKRGPIPV